jgi:pantetheine-phosphate adenylyltransferase
MNPNIESVFMSPAEEFSFLSSSIIKDIAKHKGNIDKFVDKNVANAIYKKFK